VSHWIIVPVVLPAMLAPFIVLALRRDLLLQRVFSVAGTGALLLVAAALAARAAAGGIEVYALGDWPAPFGIVLVLDRLSALMVLLTALLALAVVVYAVGSGWDARGRHFHALFQFQLMGVCGAFLTGDIFNLFVFFEVLLIASYGLMIHSGGERRLRAGVQYVLFNLAGSTLFLFGLGTIYGLTGTLNMADLAVRVAALPAGDHGLVRVAAVLLLLVFAIKAAQVPLHFWLPGTYAAAPAPVAALFAILTKVGAYAILRVFTLVFGPAAVTGALIADVLMPAALVTAALGTIGVLGARQAGMLAAFAAIASMGTLLVAFALFTPAGTAAGLYYLLHSTFATAALFLVVDLVESRRPAGGGIEVAAPMVQSGLVAWLYFAAAIAMVGMPPLSGFVGKLLVLDAARLPGPMVAVWAVVLATSLVALVGFARAGSVLFWKAHEGGRATPPSPAGLPTAAPVAATLALIGALAVLTVLAGPITGYLEATAAQLYAPQQYIEAVLAPAPAAGGQ